MLRDSSSRCRGFVSGLRLWHFLVILVCVLALTQSGRSFMSGPDIVPFGTLPTTGVLCHRYRTISMRSLWWWLVSSMVSASSWEFSQSGLEVIKLEFILRHKIKRNDWLLADTCPQAANHCTLFWVWDYSSFITSGPGLIRKSCWQSVRMLLPSKCPMMLLIMMCLQCYFIVQHRLVSDTVW